MWELAATIGSSLLGNLFGGGGDASAAKAQYRAIEQRNLNQIVRNSFRAGLLNTQLGLQKKQAAQARFETSAQGLQASGAVDAVAAASGTVGASVDAVANDLKMKVGEAMAVHDDNYEMLLINYNTDLEAMRLNALDAITQAPEYDVPSLGERVVGSALTGVAQWAGNYAIERMRLGLGTNKQGG